MIPWQDEHAILADRYAVVARDRKRGPSHADAKAIRASMVALRTMHNDSDTALDDARAAENRAAVVIAEKREYIAMKQKRGRKAEPAVRPVGRPRAVDVVGPDGVKRQCIKCRNVRPIEQYEKTTAGNYRNVCNGCRKEQRNNRARRKMLTARAVTISAPTAPRTVYPTARTRKPGRLLAAALEGVHGFSVFRFEHR